MVCSLYRRELVNSMHANTYITSYTVSSMKLPNRKTVYFCCYCRPKSCRCYTIPMKCSEKYFRYSHWFRILINIATTMKFVNSNWCPTANIASHRTNKSCSGNSRPNSKRSQRLYWQKIMLEVSESFSYSDRSIHSEYRQWNVQFH